MNRQACSDIQACFSSYLDGAVSGQEMQEISRHIEGFDGVLGCADCARELAAWRNSQEAVSSLGRAKAPADLALKLRIAISHEHARRESRLVDRLGLMWDNLVRPFAVQFSAGLAGSVVLGGGILLLLGMVAAPQPVLANDEPLGALTAPHYLYSTASPGEIVTAQDTTIVVEALVDASGRVYDFNIVSGPQDESVRVQVANQLLCSVFQPASAFGVATRGRTVVTFDGISVHG